MNKYYLDSDKMIEVMKEIMKYSDNVSVKSIIQYIYDNSISVDELTNKEINRLKRLVEHYKNDAEFLENRLIEFRTGKKVKNANL